MFAVSILFFVFPDIDLSVAELFYTPGGGFETRGVWYERLVYKSVEILTAVVATGLVVRWGWGRVKKCGALRPSGRELAYVLLVLALGPGLIVNLGFKENWGRARPAELIEFGGTKEFSPAFVPSDQGGGSFPSGHVSSAAWLFMTVLVLTRGNMLWMSFMLAYCLLVGIFRMAAGGHFASDVLVAIFIVVVLALMLHGVMFDQGRNDRAIAKVPE